MAYLLLLGAGGWSQRWEIAPGEEEPVAGELAFVGTDRTGRLRLLDPETDAQFTYVIAWQTVAAAGIIPSTAHSPERGQYA
jgi:hypothetical protein